MGLVGSSLPRGYTTPEHPSVSHIRYIEFDAYPGRYEVVETVTTQRRSRTMAVDQKPQYLIYPCCTMKYGVMASPALVINGVVMFQVDLVLQRRLAEFAAASELMTGKQVVFGCHAPDRMSPN